MNKKMLKIKIKQLETKLELMKKDFRVDLYELGQVEGSLDAFRAVLRHFKEEGE